VDPVSHQRRFLTGLAMQERCADSRADSSRDLAKKVQDLLESVPQVTRCRRRRAARRAEPACEATTATWWLRRAEGPTRRGGRGLGQDDRLARQRSTGAERSQYASKRDWGEMTDNLRPVTASPGAGPGASGAWWPGTSRREGHNAVGLLPGPGLRHPRRAARSGSTTQPPRQPMIPARRLGPSAAALAASRAIDDPTRPGRIGLGADSTHALAPAGRPCGQEVRFAMRPHLRRSG
jgi:hypothetical protein